EARSFEAEDSADVALTNAAYEIAKPWPVHRAARGATEILVDHADFAEAVTSREIDELVLQTLAFAILLHLHAGGLADVDHGTSVECRLRQFTNGHRPPRCRGERA